MPKQKQSTRRQRWQPYVRKLADLMRLRDWRVEIAEDAPSDANAIASCNPIEGRKFAVIRLSESFFTDSRDDQRQTLAHELLHCHTGPLQRLLEAEESCTPAVRHAIEYCVDGLADAIAPLLPDPPASTRSQH